jgi:hydroxymethylbilane synthase
MKRVVIGTRGSKLALWQAEWVKAGIERLHPGIRVRLNKIKTTGDKILDVHLAKVGGKGLFVKEIEEALLRKEADIAVHSVKDVPTGFPPGLHMPVICEREDPRDAFVSQVKNSGFRVPDFGSLPYEAKVGTSSMRRSCQLLSMRPDLKIQVIRGNLDTRLRKLDEGQFDAVILAAAGVKRLGWTDRITEILSHEISLPAIGQGAIGIECRIDDGFIHGLIAPLNHHETSICVCAERAFLKRLEGGCQIPVAAYGRLTSRRLGKGSGPVDKDSVLLMDGLVGSPSGQKMIRGRIEGKTEDAESVGIALAEDLLSRGAKEILDELYGEAMPPREQGSKG